MLDHIFITVTDLGRSIAFYERALKPLGIVHSIDYDGRDGPEGHPDLKGFGRDGRVFFWLRQGNADARAAHVGFIAKSEFEVNAFYEFCQGSGMPLQSCWRFNGHGFAKKQMAGGWFCRLANRG